MLDKIKTFVKSSAILTIIFYYFLTKTRLNFEKELSIVKNLQIKKPTILDIGAHNGESIKQLLYFKPNANILAFEPNKSLAEKLKHKYKNYNNIKIFNFAVSNKKKLFFYIPVLFKYELTHLSSINKKFLMYRIKNFFRIDISKFRFLKKKIKSFQIDNLNIKPNLIKIDVEGGELEVVKSGLKLIKKCKPFIVIEYNHNNFKNIFKILTKLGYKAFLLKNKLIKINKSTLIEISKARNSTNIIFKK